MKKSTIAIKMIVKPAKLIIFQLLLVYLFGTKLAFAQVEVSLAVETMYAGYQEGDEVVIRGNVPELGSWESGGQLVLNPTEEGSTEFKGKLTMPEKYVGREVLYKFLIIKPDGSIQWEERNNRSFTVTSSDRVLAPVYFSGRAFSGISTTLKELVFTLNASELKFNGIAPEAVAVMGSRGDLSFDLTEEGRTLMEESSTGIWQTKVILPFGTWPDLEFRFAWKVDGIWQWENISGHANHIAWINGTDSYEHIAMVYDAELGEIIPEHGKSQVDDYELLQHHFGDDFWATNYAYDFAMTTLKKGDRELAESSYAQYKATNPDSNGIDDFYYQLAKVISTTEGVEASLSFIEQKQASETMVERKSYYEYLKGELLFNDGENDRARGYFRKTIDEYNDQSMASGYSEQGLLLSYLYEQEEDSIKAGISLARQKLYADTTKTYMLLQHIANAQQRLGEKASLEQTLWQMAQTGPPNYRSRAVVRLAKKQANEHRFEEALTTLEQIDSLNTSLVVLEDRDFLQERIFENQGDKDKAKKLRNRLRIKYKDNERLNAFKNEEGKDQ